MAASITLRLTAVANNGQTQEEADARFKEVFAEYPEDAIADTLITDIWSNLSLWTGFKVEKMSESTEG
jgi:hypothetical protein